MVGNTPGLRVAENFNLKLLLFIPYIASLMLCSFDRDLKHPRLYLSLGAVGALSSFAAILWAFHP